MTMSFEDHSYHVERAQKCRELAAAATDPDVRRRHEELAELHAGRASMYSEFAPQQQASGLSAA